MSGDGLLLEVNDLITVGQSWSIVVSLILVFLLTTALFRSPALGLCNVVPLFAAIFFNFGVMGLFGMAKLGWRLLRAGRRAKSEPFENTGNDRTRELDGDQIDRHVAHVEELRRILLDPELVAERVRNWLDDDVQLGEVGGRVSKEGGRV